MRIRIAALLLIIMLPVSAMAQALADRLPPETVAYVGWSGPDAQAKAYDGSHLKAVLESSQLRETFTQFLPKLIEQALKSNAGAADEIGPLADMLNTSFIPYQHPFAYAFTGVSFDDPDHPMPRLVFLCDAGEDDVERVYKSVKVQFNGPTTKPLADAGFPIRVARFDTLVVGTIGYDQAQDALAGGKKGGAAKSLATDPKFKAAIATAGKNPAIVAYLNVEAGLKIVDAGIKKVDNPQYLSLWPQVRDALGLAGVKDVLWATGFDGKDWASSVFVDAPAPRKGLLTMLESRPLSEEILKAIPQDATSAGVAGFDPSKLIESIRQVATDINPDAATQLDQLLGMADQQLGMSVETDVLGSLGSEWGYYNSPSVAGDGMLGTVLVNQLRNPAKFEQALDKLQAMVNEQLEKNADPDVKVRLKQTKIGGLTIHYLATPIFTPAWGISGGRLYVGMFPQTVASAAAASGKAGGKSILDNPKFTAIRARLGAVNPSGISFSDLNATAPAAYPMWQAVSRLVGFGDMMGVDAPPMVLPPLNVLMANLAPAGSATWSDDAGWHMRSISPFPGSSLLASDPFSQVTIGQSALAISVMLPALNRAREMGNRVKSASNLRQIGLATQMYANEHKGKFPKRIGELAAEDVTPQVFINPRASSGAAAPREPLEPAALEKWIDQSRDYVYVGAGKNFTAPADDILAYENPDGLRDGINIVFCDGHVEFFPMEEAMDRIEKAKHGKAVKP